MPFASRSDFIFAREPGSVAGAAEVAKVRQSAHHLSHPQELRLVWRRPDGRGGRRRRRGLGRRLGFGLWSGRLGRLSLGEQERCDRRHDDRKTSHRPPPSMRRAPSKISPSSGVVGRSSEDAGSIQATASISSLTRASPLVQRPTKEAMTKWALTRAPSRRMGSTWRLKPMISASTPTSSKSFALGRLDQGLADFHDPSRQRKASRHRRARPSPYKHAALSEHRDRDREDRAGRIEAIVRRRLSHTGGRSSGA